jgi:hypothetical protein
MLINHFIEAGKTRNCDNTLLLSSLFTVLLGFGGRATRRRALKLSNNRWRGEQLCKFDIQMIIEVDSSLAA